MSIITGGRSDITSRMLGYNTLTTVTNFDTSSKKVGFANSLGRNASMLVPKFDKTICFINSNASTLKFLKQKSHCV